MLRWAVGPARPALPPGCGRGAAVKSVFMAARNDPRADCFPAAGENPGVHWRGVCSTCWTASPLRSGEVCPRRQAPLPPSRPPVLTDQCPHSELRLHCAHSRSAQAQGWLMPYHSPRPVTGAGIKWKKSRKHCLEALGKVFFPNKRNPDMTEQLD